MDKKLSAGLHGAKFMTHHCLAHRLEVSDALACQWSSPCIQENDNKFGYIIHIYNITF